MKKILLLLLIAISFSGCEKDDVCVDETTPRLILEFYNSSNPSDLKNVTSLEVTAEGETDSLKIYNGVSVIELPLSTNEDTTQYSLVLNSTNSTTINEDILQFNYTRSNVYVSRACGYKTIFQLNPANGVIHTDAETPDLLWIQSYSVETNNIETENEVHIKIYF
jgi:hypothetical protein